MKAVSTLDVEMFWTGTTIAKPTAQHQVVYGGRTFNVDGVANVDEQGVILKLTCKEVTNPA